MTDEQHDHRVRDSSGKFIRTLATAEREARAAELRSRGFSFRRIAEQLQAEGLAPPGYAKGDAHHDVKNAMLAVVQESAEEALAFELRRLDEELERLDKLYAEVLGILGREHITVSQGRVVTTDSGDTVPDDEFVLKCVDRLTRIDDQRRRNGESRRRLLGLDQPAKTQLSGGLTYEVVGIDPEALR